MEAHILERQRGINPTDPAHRAVKEKYDVIVAGGGDGTINAVASVVVGQSNLTLGVLPLGTRIEKAGGKVKVFLIKLGWLLMWE